MQVRSLAGLLLSQKRHNCNGPYRQAGANQSLKKIQDCTKARGRLIASPAKGGIAMTWKRGWDRNDAFRKDRPLKDEQKKVNLVMTFSAGDVSPIR